MDLLELPRQSLGTPGISEAGVTTRTALGLRLQDRPSILISKSLSASIRSTFPILPNKPFIKELKPAWPSCSAFSSSMSLVILTKSPTFAGMQKYCAWSLDRYANLPWTTYGHQQHISPQREDWMSTSCSQFERGYVCQEKFLRPAQFSPSL